MAHSGDSSGATEAAQRGSPRVMERRVRQSVCSVCNKIAGPGKGVVLNYGAYGRVHAKTCAEINFIES